MAIFDHLGLRNPWTDWNKIWHDWLRPAAGPTFRNVAVSTAPWLSDAQRHGRFRQAKKSWSLSTLVRPCGLITSPTQYEPDMYAYQVARAARSILVKQSFMFVETAVLTGVINEVRRTTCVLSHRILKGILWQLYSENNVDEWIMFVETAGLCVFVERVLSVATFCDAGHCTVPLWVSLHGSSRSVRSTSLLHRLVSCIAYFCGRETDCQQWHWNT